MIEFAILLGILFLVGRKKTAPAKPLTFADGLQSRRVAGIAVTAGMGKLTIPTARSLRYGKAAGSTAIVAGGGTGGHSTGGKQRVAP